MQLFGDFSAMTFHSGVAPEVIGSYVVIGHPFVNNTAFTEINGTEQLSMNGVVISNETQTWTGWYAQSTNATAVTNCTVGAVAASCGNSPVFFYLAAEIFVGQGFTSNATLLSYFQPSQSAVSIGPTQFAITNYTLTSPVTNEGQKWTSGYFEVGHFVGSSYEFFLAANLYSGTQPYLIFKVTSATRAS
jgi:hypothetical protein